MPDIVLTGDSHTAALRKGQIAIETEGVWPERFRLAIHPLGGGHLTCDPFFVDRGDHAEITVAAYKRQMQRLPMDDDPPGTIYGVSAPLHSVRLWRHPAWQHFAPAAMTGAASSTPVSSGMLQRLVLEDQKNVLDLLSLLKRLGKRVFVVEAPYPFHHHPAMRKTSRDIVRFVDGFYRSLVRRELMRLAVPVVAVPAGCVADGFMLDPYAQPGDHHHGNQRYGRTMMGEILAFLDRDGFAASGDQAEVIRSSAGSTPRVSAISTHGGG